MSAEADDSPEADRVPHAPHPRMTRKLIGQQNAAASFVDAVRNERMHHAWLLTGPRGVGKATLAWCIARWLLTDADSDDLSFAGENLTTRLIEALSEPRLRLIRRAFDEKGRAQAEINVAEIRKLTSFFHLTAPDDGHRVAIIDAADEMNISAANALLKLLEEPPRDTLFLLVAHQPARLLPTIRSRCRELRLHPLTPEQMTEALAGIADETDAVKLTALSEGSVGEAMRLAGQDGIARYQQIIDLFATLPRFDRSQAARLADRATGRAGDDKDGFDLITTLLDRFLSRTARAGLIGPPLSQAANGESELLVRLAPDANAARKWAEAQAKLSAKARAGRVVNLDPAALVLDMLLELARTGNATTIA